MQLNQNMSPGYKANIEFTKEYFLRDRHCPKAPGKKKKLTKLEFLVLLYGSSHYDVKSQSAGKQIKPSETKQIKKIPKVANVNLKL